MNTGIMPSLCMNLLQFVCLPASAAMLLYRLAATATTTAATTTTPTSTPSPAPTPTVRLYSTGRS